MTTAQKVTIPTSYYAAVDRIYKNSIIEEITSYYIPGEMHETIHQPCTRARLIELRERGAITVVLKIHRSEFDIFPGMQMSASMDKAVNISDSFKISELI